MPSKSTMLLRFSPILDRQISEVLNDVKSTQNEKAAYSQFTLKGYRRDLANIIRRWPSEDRKVLRQLQSEGLESLKDNEYWLKIEIKASEYFQNESIPFRRALHVFVRCFKNDKSLLRPSTVEVNNKHIHLLDIFKSDWRLGVEFKLACDFLIHDGSQKENTKVSIINESKLCLMKCIQDERVTMKIVTLSDVARLVANDWNMIFEEYSPSKQITIKSAMYCILQNHSPNDFGRIKVTIGCHMLDITDIARKFPVIIPQVESIAMSKFVNGEFGHSVRSVKARLSHGIRVLNILCDGNKKLSNDVNSYGLNAFTNDVFQWLKYANTTLEMKDFGGLKTLLEIHLSEKISASVFSEYTIKFFNIERQNSRCMDLRSVFDISPVLFSDIVSLHSEEISLIDQKSYGIETLHTRFTKLRSISVKYLSDNESKIVIDSYGLRFLSEDGGKHQLRLLSQIQSDVKSQSISRRTGTSYFEVIRWVANVTGQAFIDAYRVSNNRFAVHARRISIDDTFSDDEIRELAFYLEKAIYIGSYSGYDLLALYFARIQLKTCWNTSSLARVEVSDIVDIDVPITNRPITVLLQKPRKGYQTDTFTFDSRVSASAIHDLKYVRDEITRETREKHQDSSLSSSIFIYIEMDILKLVDFNAVTQKIAKLLTKEGCSVRYNSEKVRKTGSNAIYRQVAKDVRNYKNILRHNYPTFVKHYQRVSEVKTQATLHDATTIMERYFTGREISSDIIIFTEDDSNMQITPVGLCSSNKGSKESNAYKREHAKLNSPNVIDRCGDFLACVWCKYFRTVADADHVWQILTFKEFVLADMESSVSHFETETLQRNAIDALKNRVDSILESIGNISKKALDGGFVSFKKYGAHPSWEFIGLDTSGGNQ